MTVIERRTATRKSAGGVASDVVRFEPGAAEADLAKFTRRRRIIDRLLRWGTPTVLFVLWQVAAVNGWVDRRFFPAPSDIWTNGTALWTAGVLQEEAGRTIGRLLIGFFSGAVSGIAVGLLLGTFRYFRVALLPIIYALYTIPKLAILPLLLLIFGLNDTPILVLIGISVFFLVSISVAGATTSVSEGYLETANAFGANHRQIFQHVLLPAVLPAVMVSLRVASGVAILVVVGVEFVQGGGGLGYLIWSSWQLFLAERMYVGIVAVALIGVLSQSLIGLVGRFLVPWEKGTRHGL